MLLREIGVPSVGRRNASPLPSILPRNGEECPLSSVLQECIPSLGPRPVCQSIEKACAMLACEPGGYRPARHPYRRWRPSTCAVSLVRTGRESRPAPLNVTVLFEGSYIYQVIGDWACSHTPYHLGQNVESNIRWNLMRHKIEHCLRGKEKTRKGQVARWIRGFLDKIADDPISVDLHNSASACRTLSWCASSQKRSKNPPPPAPVIFPPSAPFSMAAS